MSFSAIIKAPHLHAPKKIDVTLLSGVPVAKFEPENTLPAGYLPVTFPSKLAPEG